MILFIPGTHYSFSYHAPSLLAASAVLAALYSLSSERDFVELVGRELRLRVQTVTHTATVSLEGGIKQIYNVRNPIPETVKVAKWLLGRLGA